MKKWLQIPLWASGLLLLAPALHAQAVPTGVYKSHIEAGVGAMYLNNDYSERKNGGLTIWGDYDFTHLIGAEVEAHFGGIITPDDIGENSYLIGPRLMYHKRKLTIYGKLMLGRGTITNQLYNQSSSYNIVPAYGGGVEYRLSHHLQARVDLEDQKWPDFEPNTLSPLAISFGIMYVIR